MKLVFKFGRHCLETFRSVQLRQLSTLKKTVLHDFHCSHGGSMVPFAGWSMPAVYKGLSIVESVNHTRRKLSLFDVSHMLQFVITGHDSASLLESLVVSDIKRLKEGQGTLSLITNSAGGIVDDCIITRTGTTSFYVVSNASRSEVVLELMKTSIAEFCDHGSDVSISQLEEKSLIALQGPCLSRVSEEVLQCDLNSLHFMNSAVMRLLDVADCRVSRCGYTGEDGVEISVDSSKVVELCEKLIKHEAVELAGLGSRDVLRVEAGLCLYGNELDDTITPVEAGLSWCIGKSRRKGAIFPGSEIIFSQSPKSVLRRRVGLISAGPVLRKDCPILDDKGVVVGNVTSGCPSPTLGSNIAMAYIPPSMMKTGNTLNVLVRKKVVKAIVAKLPFIKCNYYTE